MTDQAKGVLITALGVLAIVPDTLFIRLIDADILTIVFWRAFLAAISVTFGICLFYRKDTIVIIRGMGLAGFTYAFFMGMGTISFVSAVQITSVANAVFIVSISPVFAALISRIFLGEQISMRMVWTIAGALVGVCLIAVESIRGGSSHIGGDLLALLTAFSMAAAFVVARAAKHISMIPAAAMAYCITSLMVAPFASVSAMDGADWLWAVLMGCFFVPIGASLLAIGPRYITAAEVSLLLLLEAILAPLLIWAVLGEQPGLLTILGGALIISVLAMSNLLALRRTPAVVAE
ncbi:DMT family transporter [Coralliovum pocilloporae]|uniref:DMT family transporter n=1 Tax=Coralliovum pocilloporae TaxID=3066369 RepID=UPI00330705E7